MIYKGHSIIKDTNICRGKTVDEKVISESKLISP